MYDFNTRYLASVFLDAGSYGYKNEIIKLFQEAIQNDRFIQFPVIQNVKGQTIQRFGFSDGERGINLIILTNRFDFSMLPVESDFDNFKKITFKNFLKEATDKIIGILNKLGNRPVTRLAVVREGIVELGKRVSDDAMRGKLIKLYGPFSEKPIFQWDWRVNARIKRRFGEFTEETNTIVTIKRVHTELMKGEQMLRTVDGFSIGLDINTDHLNLVDRFKEKDIRDFFTKAIEWHSELEKTTKDYLMGA